MCVCNVLKYSITEKNYSKNEIK